MNTERQVFQLGYLEAIARRRHYEPRRVHTTDGVKIHTQPPQLSLTLISEGGLDEGGYAPHEIISTTNPELPAQLRALADFLEGDLTAEEDTHS